jgi:hypothetical protein
LGCTTFEATTPVGCTMLVGSATRVGCRGLVLILGMCARARVCKCECGPCRPHQTQHQTTHV